MSIKKSKPGSQKEPGDFGRRYAVPLILVGSVIAAFLIITLAGIF